jgi:hypothetical protein
MSIIEKRDVKNHLSLRHSRDIHLCEPLSQSGIQGSSVAEADATNANPPVLAVDYSAEQTIVAVRAPQTVNSTRSIDSQGPDTSKSEHPNSR